MRDGRFIARPISAFPAAHRKTSCSGGRIRLMRMLRAPADHAVALFQQFADLAVDGQVGGVDRRSALMTWITLSSCNITGRLVSICGQMGVMASAATRRKNNGAAGRKRIRGGAGGRGDDQSIGLVDAHEAAVDVHFQIDHARDLGFGQHHVVERVDRRPRDRRRATVRNAACGGARCARSPRKRPFQLRIKSPRS